MHSTARFVSDLVGNPEDLWWVQQPERLGERPFTGTYLDAKSVKQGISKRALAGALTLLNSPQFSHNEAHLKMVNLLSKDVLLVLNIMVTSLYNILRFLWL